MDLEQVEKDLISEIQLTDIQSRVFLLLVTKGKMTYQKISEMLKITNDEALSAAKDLVGLGGFIEMSETEFETMHPRFTAVNMYRKMCEREKIEFRRNVTVDNIGVSLEKLYEEARTK